MGNGSLSTSTKTRPVYTKKFIFSGTQRFVEVPCSLDDFEEKSQLVDIYIQFGILSQEQQDYLEDPSRYLGVAVRTDYDWNLLKSKGFIYITPHRGPYRFKDPEMHPTPWALNNAKLLYLTLVHEMGHIFGIQHTGGKGLLRADIMSPELLNFIMRKDIAEQVANNDRDIPGFFNNSNESEYVDCKEESSSFDEIIRKEYLINQDHKCLILSFSSTQHQLFSAFTDRGARMLIAEIDSGNSTRIGTPSIQLIAKDGFTLPVNIPVNRRIYPYYRYRSKLSGKIKSLKTGSERMVLIETYSHILEMAVENDMHNLEFDSFNGTIFSPSRSR